MPSQTATTPDLASELAARLGSLQRVLRRRTRAAIGDLGLSPAEVELLRLVVAQPSLRVGEAATALRLAPNTVSTLARRLAEQGLVAAERDEGDRRGIRLRPSAAADRRIRRWRDERAQLLGGVLERLSDSERQALVSVLPVLATLVEALEEGEA